MSDPADPAAKAGSALLFEYRRALALAGDEDLAQVMQRAGDLLMTIAIRGVAGTVELRQRALAKEPRT